MQLLNYQPVCSASQIPILFRQGEVYLSPAAVKKTLLACRLDDQSGGFSLQDIRLFASARFLRCVEGFDYDEISDLIQQGDYSLEGLEFDSIDDVGEWYRSEIESRKSKVELANIFSISLNTVARTLWVCNIPTRRQLYGDTDFWAFSIARSMIENLDFTYFQTRAYFVGGKDLDSIVKNLEDVYWTKQDLMAKYSLSLLTVRATLKACGLPTDKRAYSVSDVAIFRKARDLIEKEGLRYNDVENGLILNSP